MLHIPALLGQEIVLIRQLKCLSHPKLLTTFKHGFALGDSIKTSQCLLKHFKHTYVGLSPHSRLSDLSIRLMKEPRAVKL